MIRLVAVIFVIMLLVPEVNAVSYGTAPVSSDLNNIVDEKTQSFAEGLLMILKDALPLMQSAFYQAVRICVVFVATAILISIVQNIRGGNDHIIQLVGALAVSTVLLKSSETFIRLATDTVTKISEYGKLLLPVMTAALAAEGGVNQSTVLYTGTVAFHTVLSTAISVVIVPIVYVFLCISTAYCAIGETMLGKIKDFIKWLATWLLKTILYAFTGYIGITGVISGTADAAALKVTKIAISNAVPVVGGILSNASETVLVSAAMAKNAAGIYGLLAFVSIFIGPFLQTGTQYLLLKLTGAICSVFGSKQMVDILKDFSSALGLLLALIGTVSLMMMISTVCFMKGTA